jgi:hypothetical protein
MEEQGTNQLLVLLRIANSKWNKILKPRKKFIISRYDKRKIPKTSPTIESQLFLKQPPTNLRNIKPPQKLRKK